MPGTKLTKWGGVEYEEDYLRLHHYKNPSFHKNGVGIGDFSLCVFDVVKSYCK